MYPCLLFYHLMRCDFRLSVFGKEIIVGLRHQIVESATTLNGQNLQLIANLSREMAGDGRGAGSARRLIDWRGSLIPAQRDGSDVLVL